MPMTRKRLPKRFVTVPHYSHIFRGKIRSTDQRCNISYRNKFLFATVVAGKFREPTGNIFVGFASYTANQQDENRNCIRAKRECLN